MAVSAVEGHGQLFCSALQFKTWNEPLICRVKNVMNEEDEVEAEEKRSKRGNVFDVIPKVCNMCKL